MGRYGAYFAGATEFTNEKNLCADAGFKLPMERRS